MIDERVTFWDLHRRLGELHEQEMSRARDSKRQVKPAGSRSYDSADLQSPADLVASGTDSTDRTLGSRAGSKVRFVRPPEVAPPQFMELSENPELEVEAVREAHGFAYAKQQSGSKEGTPRACSPSAYAKQHSWSIEGDRFRHEDSVQSVLQTYSVRKNWMEQGVDESMGETTPSALQRRTSCTLPTVTSFKDEVPGQYSPLLLNFLWMLQHPASRFRVWWGPLGMLLLAYDVIIIPLRFFTLEETPAMIVLSWIARLYWSFDMIFSFTTGFYDSGLLVLDLRKTAKNYVKGWFTFDLLVVCLDWVLLVWDDLNDETEGLPRLSKTMRITRLFRLVRLGRLFKVGAITETFQEQLSSESASIHYSIIRIIVSLMVMNHVLACLWFGVASLEDGPSWVTVNGLEQASVPFQYATSLHWSVAQLGVGQTEIEATTLSERCFSIVVMLSALLSFSTLVSSMTSLMARLDQLKTEEVSQFRSLRRFVAENDIDQELSHRVMRFLQHSLAVKRSVQRDDREVLELLSKPLQGELLLERHKACFAKHGFFSLMMKNPGFHHIREMRHVAMDCMQPQVMAPGDVVFAAGSLANTCFYLEKGSFHYTFEKTKEKVSQTWIAEMCLWMPWTYAGDLVAKDTSRLISLELSSFVRSVGKVEATKAMAQRYAKECADAMNAKNGPVSDLWATIEREGTVNPSRSGVFSRILPLD